MPNWAFNADANTGHGFAIFMASVGALRPLHNLADHPAEARIMLILSRFA